ncbi:MAG: sulfurtransferase TusA family protein [Desulfosarcinaceae bacterium]|nr:sulfurtransferase TusA family protein [Desulfosarcinaceae bacterium]
MSDATKISKSLDLKGLACPMPVVKISKGIKEVAVGEILEAHTTDPGSLTDIPAWGRTTGHEIVDASQDGENIRFLIRRTS